MSIQDLLSSPESKTLEFKDTMPTPLAIAKTACAFSNAGGGTILIGVEDKNKTKWGYPRKTYSFECGKGIPCRKAPISVPGKDYPQRWTTP